MVEPRPLKSSWLGAGTQKLQRVYRLPYFVEMLRDSLFEAIEAKPEWQVYHPLTPLADLHHLRSGLLVCIAGRVIEPPTQKRQGKLGSYHV